MGVRLIGGTYGQRGSDGAHKGPHAIPRLGAPTPSAGAMGPTRDPMQYSDGGIRSHGAPMQYPDWGIRPQGTLCNFPDWGIRFQRVI